MGTYICWFYLIGKHFINAIECYLHLPFHIKGQLVGVFSEFVFLWLQILFNVIAFPLNLLDEYTYFVLSRSYIDEVGGSQYSRQLRKFGKNLGFVWHHSQFHLLVSFRDVFGEILWGISGIVDQSAGWAQSGGIIEIARIMVDGFHDFFVTFNEIARRVRHSVRCIEAQLYTQNINSNSGSFQVVQYWHQLWWRHSHCLNQLVYRLSQINIDERFTVFQCIGYIGHLHPQFVSWITCRLSDGNRRNPAMLSTHKEKKFQLNSVWLQFSLSINLLTLQKATKHHTTNSSTFMSIVSLFEYLPITPNLLIISTVFSH